MCTMITKAQELGVMIDLQYVRMYVCVYVD